ncbi:MAG: hypothetical protein HKN37_00390 [Rhodothermales bacterium]|nr:hypothetical protein [Rhodothermales bacterium]
MTHLRDKVILAAAIILIVGVAGCVSTQKRFDRGVKAEQAGHYEEAAGHYIQVLQKEPDWEEALVGLRRTGAIVIENLLGEASRLEDAERYVESANMLDRISAFHARANSVRADLQLPPDFRNRRDRMEDRAVRKLLSEADRARLDGHWAKSLGLYDQALQRGRLTAAEVAEVRESRVLVLAGWSEQALRERYYRIAFDKAQQALDLVGVEHTLSQRFSRVQASALEEGSRFVAMLPVAATEDVRRRTGTLFLSDLNDILAYDHWATPPPFVLVADPVEVRREIRSMLGRSGRVVTKGEAVAVGRAMDADWVFVADLVRFDRDQRERDRDRVNVKTRGRSPLDTSYVLRKVRVLYYTRVEVRIYDVRSGRELYDGRVDASAEDGFERGEYAGDYRDLDLSGRELSYFDSEEIRLQEDALEEAMADQLAAKVAERVYSTMLRWIP